MFKVVIFDFVGIFSEHENYYSVLKKITGFKGTVKSLEAYLGNALDDLLVGKITELKFWNKLKKVTNTRKTVDSIKKSFLKSFKPLFSTINFNNAKNNFKVALCSEFVNSWWLYLKDKFNISFDYEVLSSSLKKNKNSSELFLSVPNYFKVKPNDCVYVSDEVRDIRMAEGLGMETVFIPGKSSVSKKADYIYKTVDEFLEVLN